MKFPNNPSTTTNTFPNQEKTIQQIQQKHKSYNEETNSNNPPKANRDGRTFGDGENLTVENGACSGDGDGRRWWRWSTVLVGGAVAYQETQKTK